LAKKALIENIQYGIRAIYGFFFVDLRFLELIPSVFHGGELLGVTTTISLRQSHCFSGDSSRFRLLANLAFVIPLLELVISSDSSSILLQS